MSLLYVLISKKMAPAHDCWWSGESKDLDKVEDEERRNSEVCPGVKFGFLLIGVRQITLVGGDGALLDVFRLDLVIELGLVMVRLVLVDSSGSHYDADM